MSNIELDNFDDYRNYIRECILLDENLWKLIFYASSSPLDLEYIENPYEIFNENSDDKHGVVLFKEKDIVILNYTTPIILINMESYRDENNYSVQNVKIEIKIIFKGELEELADESNRAHRIAELFSNHLDGQKVDNNKIRRESFDILTGINEENYGHKLTFITKITDYSDEIQIYQHEQNEDTYGITRESYTLLSTDSPILVGIQLPCVDDRIKEQYGYDLNTIATMTYDKDLGITESTLIKYNDNYYKIVKTLDYNDYLVCSLVITYKAIIN